MVELAEMAIKSDILSLVTEYWNDVDTNWGARAHTMFTEDGVFGSGESAYTGQLQIKAFYDWRVSRGDRVARHLINNPMITIDSPRQAMIRYIMTIYAVDGVPVLSVNAPNSISEVVEVLVRDAEGNWKIRSKTFHALFKGGEPTTTMPAHLRKSLLPDAQPRDRG